MLMFLCLSFLMSLIDLAIGYPATISESKMDKWMLVKSRAEVAIFRFFCFFWGFLIFLDPAVFQKKKSRQPNSEILLAGTRT